MLNLNYVVFVFGMFVFVLNCECIVLGSCFCVEHLTCWLLLEVCFSEPNVATSRWLCTSSALQSDDDAFASVQHFLNLER